MQLSILLGVMGPWQIVLIVVVLLLLFGGKKIPELMRGLGTGMKEFKEATKEDKEPIVRDSDNIRNENIRNENVRNENARHTDSTRVPDDKK